MSKKIRITVLERETDIMIWGMEYHLSENAPIEQMMEDLRNEAIATCLIPLFNLKDWIVVSMKIQKGGQQAMNKFAKDFWGFCKTKTEIL